MEIFGLKSKKVYGCFELKYLTLLMMLIPCSWTQDNIPSFNVTCDSDGLYVEIAFSKPFSGIVYADGYRFDPSCSMTVSSAMNGSLTLPLSDCGTMVEKENIHHPWIANMVVIQQHPLIRTANDFEELLICSLPPFYYWDPPLLTDQIYDTYFLPLTESPSDIEFGSYVFHEELLRIFRNAHTRLKIYQLENGTIYKDIVIKSCIVHNEGILDEDASEIQISSPEGCVTVNSENPSNLTIIEYTDGLIGYVDIDKYGLVPSDDFYLTCEVVFCKAKCRCSEIQQQTEHQTSVSNHKLTKRSTDTSSEMFSLKQYESRTQYLKSTVKALMDRIIEQRKQNDKKSKIRKRLMRMDDSALPSDTNSLGSGLGPSKISSLEPVSTYMHTISSLEPVSTYMHNIEPHLEDVDYDSEDSHHDYWEESSHTTELSTDDYDLVVTTSPKEFKDNATETVLDEDLQEKDAAVLTADLVSPVNEVTENTETTTTHDSFPSIVEDVSGHHDSCIPRMRFITVIIVMGFFLGCLLMVGCGMALYIRKEKKRSRLNDFLLYSISF